MASQRDFYAGRIAVLATMHGKELAIAAPFSKRLGLTLSVTRGLNTDHLGTFTGDVPRSGTIKETAVTKARLGMRATGLPVGVASEGSYGPHPQLPLIPAGLECMVLVDDARNIIISEHSIDKAPAYGSTQAAHIENIEVWLRRFGFPSHAVIVQPNVQDDSSPSFHKGLQSKSAVAAAIKRCSDLSHDGIALVTTDMRAHLNPTRMKTLAVLAEKLANRIAVTCPTCRTPGYGQVGAEKGLPCSWCDRPSELTAREILGCVACDYREERPRSDGIHRADPSDCASCNP